MRIALPRARDAGGGAAQLVVCAVLLVLLTAAGLAIPHPVPGQFGIGYGRALDEFVAIACVQGLVYAAAILLLLRRRIMSGAGLAIILGTAILLRVLVLAVPPFLSNDIYRYVWDGWVQAAGINPYRYIPDDAHLAFLRDAVVFPHINRASYAPTIYPPAAQALFFVIASLDRFFGIPPVLGMKCGMVACEAAGIAAMSSLLAQAGMPRTRILIYAWNPLPLWEFSGSGHIDAVAVCFVALALLAAAAGRSGFAAAALAAATLTKFLPLVLLPALWRRREQRFAGIFFAVILLLYLPYLGAGTKILGFLGGYTRQEGIAGGQGIFLLALIGHVIALPAAAAKLYLVLLAAILAAMAVPMLRDPPPPLRPARAHIIARRAGWLGVVLLIGLAPHYPWYTAFLLVPACITAEPAILYLVTASFLLYLNPAHTRLLWPAVLFVPAAALAIGAAWSTRPAAALAPRSSP